MIFDGKNNKQTNFFDLLKHQADITVEGVRSLCDFCENPTCEKADKVVEYEHKADDARRLLISEMNKTFITPIDREDLFALSEAIDELADDAKRTMQELRIYKIAPDEYILKLCDILIQIAENAAAAVMHLERNKDIANDKAIKIKKLDGTATDTYHLALVNLFEMEDIKCILKYREIYRHLNRATAKGNRLADKLFNTIMKM